MQQKNDKEFVSFSTEHFKEEDALIPKAQV